MNILLIGSGGREHALAWKISQSSRCGELFIAPGNPGTAECGENVSLDVKNFEAIKEFIGRKNIEMVVVGPEDPLVAGIADFLNEIVPVVGPVKAGAMLEGSKDFAKQFMQKYKIPTAAYRSFSDENFEAGIDFIDRQEPPVVLKADGLAAGKGVLICSTREEAKKALSEMIRENKFGDAGQKVVVEQFLKGIELSVFVLTDSKSYKILPTSKDYKRIGEGDTGLNTGGMGAVSPVPFADDKLMKKIEEQIIRPTLEGLQKEDINYKGFIYFGLIKVNDDPYVIEYNVRLGDPETEAVLPRIESDLVELFESLADNTLHEKELKIKTDAAATIVLASGGYPEKYEKGKIISGLEKAEEALVFHAGTQESGGDVTTSGGRVIAVTALAENLQKALQKANEAAEVIEFENKYFRRDIGRDVL